jgi:O-antigen ligase
MAWAMPTAVAMSGLSLLGVLDLEKDLISPRGFALFLLLPLAQELARWRGGNARGLFVAIFILAVIFHSMSRMALITAAAMFPLAVIVRGDRKALVHTLLVCAVCGVTLALAIRYYPPMYNRWIGEDQVAVAGVSVNVTGRTAVWARIWESWKLHPIFGQGGGSTFPYTDKDNMGHPHNDYLRLLHDYGLVGASLWVIGIISLCVRIFRNARQTWRDGLPGEETHVAAFVALVGTSIAMSTDNSISYIFVMAPLGVMIGASLGTWAAYASAAAPEFRLDARGARVGNIAR